MKIQAALALMGCALFAAPAYPQAPSWSDAQAEVWAVVQQSWKDDAGETERWPNEYAHDKFVSWSDARPAPHDRETSIKWERTNEKTADTFWYEITPLAIVVEGGTAVVMYSLLEGEEDQNGERTFTAYGIVEVLVRESGDWRYLASTSFSPDRD